MPDKYVHCGIGLLMTLVSIPLILKKVHMNRPYGIRVGKAFTSMFNAFIRRLPER